MIKSYSPSFLNIPLPFLTNVSDKLHLSVSKRSFRSENVSNLVKKILDIEILGANTLYREAVRKSYPIFVTRNLEKAKEWLKEKAKGSERYGMIASSGARRLRSHGIWVKNKCRGMVFK